MHTHTPQGEKFPKISHPGGAAAGGSRKIFFGHTQCVHTPLVPKPMPTYDTGTNLFSSIIVSFQAAIFIERHMKAVSKIAFLSQQFQQVDAVSFATGLLFSCKKKLQIT